MPASQRRERERADRQELILRTARSIAETDGWDAVTTRRLAERIDYSQPVLYSHFAGKREILAAVAVQGFAELTAVLRAAPDLVAGYVDFGLANPALYDAMFSLATDLPWGTRCTGWSRWPAAAGCETISRPSARRSRPG